MYSNKPIRKRPGQVRDAIVSVLRAHPGGASVTEITAGVSALIGEVAPSSVRSYLRLNTPTYFARMDRAQYVLNGFEVERPTRQHAEAGAEQFQFGHATLVLAEKLRSRRGGVWRIPPSFDGAQRSPLPRFTVLRPADLAALGEFFHAFGHALMRVLVPGANVIVASNPVLSHVASGALARSGLERRGEIVRLVMTMRGGDRPKAAHIEFADVSVMPRSMWEPWLVFRKPLEGRVQDNLRKWGTGGFRRISKDRPFGDVIESAPTRATERALAPHPSLKPQAFLRKVVRGALPLGKGILLDPFAGSGSTLAAAEAVGYRSIGVERDAHYFNIATNSLPRLSALRVNAD